MTELQTSPTTGTMNAETPGFSPIQRSLSILVYGESKCGKSTLAATAPYPRLMLDVEGGARFLPIIPKAWDPKNEPPPIADGTWDTCVVPVLDYETMLAAYKWLHIGQHQFKSVSIDSISELQVKLMDQLAGTEQMKMQTWGELLRHFSNLLRNLRDLTMHPTNPLECVVLTAMAKDTDRGMRPYLQGQVGTIITYFWDVVGALAVEEWPNTVDPTQPPYKLRRLYVERTSKYEAGERVQGRLGSVVEQGNLNIETMLDMVYGPKS